jgi:Icc-related predicted phosphoesterase
MIIDCIADLHGHYPKLEGGDLLIVAGDLTARDTVQEYEKFCDWMHLQNHYQKKIVIAGNHDNGMVGKKAQKCLDPINPNYEWFEYLCDSGTDFNRLKIWGSPWTKTFEGMNPRCKAFTCDTEEELAVKFSLIPDDIDILITHSPPNGVLDIVQNYITGKAERVGSKSLRRIIGRIQPKLWVCGHIHEGYGEFKDDTLTRSKYHIVNCSHVNERYEPVNKPVRVIL